MELEIGLDQGMNMHPEKAHVSMSRAGLGPRHPDRRSFHFSSYYPSSCSMDPLNSWTWAYIP